MRTPQDAMWMFARQTGEHAIVVIDLEGRIRWINPGAETIFGYKPEEIVGETAERLFTPEDIAKGLPAVELAVAGSDHAAEDDRWQQRADGSRFWASGMMLSLRDEAGKPVGFVKLLRDRTDVREQIVALRNQVQELQAGSKRMDVFLSTLSHELRNPLAPLSNAVRIIREAGADQSAAPTDVEYALRIVERQTELLRRLVDDLLEFARVGAGKLELQKKRLAMQEVISQAAESTRGLVEQRRHKLDMVFPTGPVMVDGDPDRLLQVFVNLLNNAAKYTPPGGHIWIQLTTEGHEGVAHIRDNGIGIPTDMLPRIFELFTQVDSARVYSQGGLGIGLSLVKNFVTLHGGSVQVRSEGEGKGAEFSVRLPLAE